MKILLKSNKKKNKGIVFSRKNGVIDVSQEEALRLSKIYDIDVLDSTVPGPKKGKNVAFLQELIYKIGGIEEFLTNIAFEYADYNITLYYNRGDPQQLINLSKLVNIKKFDEHTTIKCDVMLINNYHMVKVLDYKNVFKKKAYVVVHADFRGHLRIENIGFTISDKVDGYIAVSEAAHDGLKEAFGLDSKIIYNFISDKNKTPKLTKFITLSRATKEKGIHRIIEMCNKFRDSGRPFIWFLCSTLDQLEDYAPELLEQIKNIPELVIVQPSISNKDLISACDYVVQLSSVESYCYSLKEGLKRNIPVISTDYPEAIKYIVNGKNGYLVNMDLSNVDIDKIFDKIPKAAEYVEECNKQDWINLFESGELNV